MATTGCEISHKDTKNTDKCNNKAKKTQKQNDETRQILFQNIVKVMQKKV
jgi:hypothetical protein